MAEEDAEMAFFQAQAMNTDSVDYKAGEEHGADSSDSDDYDPSKTLQDQDFSSLTESKQSENVPSNASPDPQPSEQSSAAPDNEPDQPAGTSFPSETPSRAESRNSTSVPTSGTAVQPKTRTIGGFVVEDEDEEEEEDDAGDADYEPPAVLGVEEMNAVSTSVPQQSVSGNENEASSTPDVSLDDAVQQPASLNNAPHNSYSPPAAAAAPQSDVVIAPGQNMYNSQALQSETAQDSAAATPAPGSHSTSKGRLPHDRVGILEDRIQEDPRGDIPAWLELINEHRNRNRIDGARDVFERFLKVFPFSAEEWVAYAKMESEINDLYRLEQIFNRTLLTIPDVQLWSVYLDYVRRRNPLTTDTTGQARRIISSAYDLALQHVGVDKDSGSIWTDYVQFVKTGPGNVGGSGWQDQQKMDLLRKAYQKAICVPTQAVNTLWKEYDQFEMGLNKLTGRKFLQEQSPAYMTARSSYTELQNITRDLNRTTLPRLPPVPGSEGDIEYTQQVDIWKRWIKWERGDPLVLKEEDPAAFKSRVVYVYKQALMALRFLPEMWYDAAEFCFLNDMENEGNEFLKQGMEANPESCLLAFKRADRLEITSESEQDSIKRGAKVREPYDKLLDALYDLIAKARTRESQDVARLEETFANMNDEKPSAKTEDDEDDQSEAKARESVKNAQIDAVRKAHAIQIGILSKTISFAWIALMRAMRRIQGKGKPGETPGSRQIFADARKRGRITSDVYIASALIEYHCYKDPAATKIFERGAKLFPEDENIALEYLKHLIDINDVINARAVFEMTVRKLASNPENAHKTKPIFAFLHEYESRYGDLVQVVNLENRMRELFPEDPALEQFAHRYSTPAFDPTTVRPIISPSQARPKMAFPTTEQPVSRHGTPTPRYPGSVTDSPKRPLEDFDDDYSRPRKFVRAESPLKTTQRRQLDQQKRSQLGSAQASSQYRPQGSPAPLPRDIVHLLSIIPPASAYTAGKFSPEKLVDLIRRIDMPSSISQIPLPQSARGLGNFSGKSWSLLINLASIQVANLLPCRHVPVVISTMNVTTPSRKCLGYV
ncbi:cleavage polyadenylation factor subunit RNA14 [Aspergillus clavatus NRRL 1]|uniref:mRNA 3'-end-processing protein RNA14 n=1 Tax=Aspergillus clavatus (strain ATCC 1007 / CBS 513.65 / DSM 816 / NCTC 3887 / NRRL 1 / QM 1276 / 107) TaxID=344612 RepID=A1CKK5_ASPCL|nr:CFIA complex component Rna14, putative [Aspergillus clavatus NRRL 1]EAW09679.1 CFIA complex component Rna14, putative [Aspergillus clavatus NRRL 1]